MKNQAIKGFETKSDKLKIAFVADHFMTESFYTNTLKRFSSFENVGISYFGANTREEMRKLVDRIEKVGPESYDPPAEL